MEPSSLIDHDFDESSSVIASTFEESKEVPAAVDMLEKIVVKHDPEP